MISRPGASSDATTAASAGGSAAAVSAQRRRRMRREGKWSKRQTFLFIVASIAILWGALIGAGVAIWFSLN
ncbi:hypothetical protein P7B02_01985 [Caulobacter segnis]|uniref:hypothetical protein n=1 Tax=Caulobacter segnis TaxID=88688 RepID=UPI00241087D3|nr:hypothetical protein [Caulobacter segnis]MDG2520295.1 hypothetical protein [Caulobacter segnis]